MELLFTVYFSVLCPNEQFTSFKTNLSYSEAVKEVEYFKANPNDNEDVVKLNKCVIVNPIIERQGS